MTLKELIEEIKDGEKAKDVIADEKLETLTEEEVKLVSGGKEMM